MARRKKDLTQPPDSVTPVIPPIPDAPGPEAAADALTTHYRLVSVARGIHAYDDVIVVCHWCLADAPLTHTKVNDPRGTRIHCSSRCAEAYDAHLKHQRERGRERRATPAVPSDSDETVDDSYDKSPETEPEIEPTPVTGGANGEPISQITEIVGEEGQGRTEWQPKGLRPRKKRNGNGRGQKDRCIRDHDMTGDNVYHHPNGSKKCRQCQSERLAKMRGKA